jgi:FKBP-type peptidyl-prolyl cis-trans isomerase FklB
MQGKQQEKMKMLGEENQKDGAAFLVENMKRDGVKTLPSGLQYKVITEGTGKSPSATDTVTVQYKGSLIDGTEFDSSYKRGQPATFALNGVIKGWTEALQLMKEGSKWQIFLPSNLAYGETGTVGGPIGPNAALIFEVELVAVKGK